MVMPDEWSPQSSSCQNWALRMQPIVTSFQPNVVLAMFGPTQAADMLLPGAAGAASILDPSVVAASQAQKDALEALAPDAWWVWATAPQTFASSATYPESAWVVNDPARIAAWNALVQQFSLGDDSSELDVASWIDDQPRGWDDPAVRPDGQHVVGTYLDQLAVWAVECLDSGYLPTGAGPHAPPAPTVGITADPVGPGYWTVGTNGQVVAQNGAPFFGDLSAESLNAPVVGMAATPDGRGYWLAASDGGVFAFGDARYLGSMGHTHLNAPVVGVAATEDGGGYWLVAADGGVFTFGDAGFVGSAGDLPLNAPIVAMVADAATGGYWLVASDGGVFSYDAPFLGSAAHLALQGAVVGAAPIANGRGYRMVTGAGEVVSFPTSVGSEGTVAAPPATAVDDVVGIASSPTESNAYWTASSGGGVATVGTTGGT
jgi:hypothetical protein